MKCKNFILNLLVFMLLLIGFGSMNKCYAQSTCYNVNGNFITFFLPCTGMTVYHNQDKPDHDFTRKISDIDHMGVGKRQPGDPQSLFIFMNKAETDYYVIIFTDEKEVRELEKALK